MTFNHLWILHLLWLLPGTGVLLVIHSRLKRRALERMADSELLKRLTGKVHKGRRFLKGMFLIAALGLMIFALAGPRWGSHYQEVSRKGVDIMILVDVSPSMLVQDIKPDRLERARREILDFLRVVQGDRVGLTAFAGAAFVQCPLTLDYEALKMFLSALRPDLIPVPGTDLGAAIETGITSFDFQAETDKVMLLITDGEDNEGRGVEAAQTAARKGIKIFVFGMGETSGGPIPAGADTGGFRKDPDGNLILSRLDEAELMQIASTTGGRYVRSVAGDLDLDILYFEGIRHSTVAQTLKSGKIKVYEERFAFFLLGALVLLLLESAIPERSNPGTQGNLLHRRQRSRRLAFPFLAVALVLLAPRFLSALEPPDELFRTGRFAEAEKSYAQLDMDHPRDIRYRYNRGCAAFQNENLQGAEGAFASVLRRAQDSTLKFRAAYNLGMIAFKQGHFESSADRFRQAIEFDPTSEDARYNLELALREYERAKKQEKAKSQEPSEQPEDHKDRSKSDRNEQGSRKALPGHPQTDPGNQPDTKNKQTEESNQSNTAQDAKDKQPAHRDLSGELKPRQGMGEQQPKPNDSQAQTGAALDKKKAEALLDNLQEDRSRFLQFQIPEDKRKGVASGKDW
jgi:Ca-activated chloride channel family protein